MALVSTPAVFAVPSSINKGFNPPFVLRVGVVSNAPTQIKATVAAYVLQKDQVGRLAHSCTCNLHTFNLQITPPVGKVRDGHADVAIMSLGTLHTYFGHL